MVTRRKRRIDGFTAQHDKQNARSHSVLSSYGHHMIYDGFRSVDNNTEVRVVDRLQVRPDLDLGAGRRRRTIRRPGQKHQKPVQLRRALCERGGRLFAVQWLATERLRLNSGFSDEHNSVSGDVAVPELGAAYRLSSQYSVSMAIGKGFRNPTIRELYLFPAPTPTLKTERLWNYQATFHFRPASSVMGWVTGYYADVRDLFVTTGRFPNLKLENIGRSSNRRH